MTEQESQPQGKEELEVQQPQCPNCGSLKRVGLSLVTKEALKHGTPLPPNTLVFILVGQVQVGTNIVTFFFDVCEDCNIIYLVGQQTRSNLVVPQVDLRNIRLDQHHPGFRIG